MTGAVRFPALTSGQISIRRERLTDFLDVWGDLRVEDLGGVGERRILEFYLEAPGWELPIEIKARYREYYRRGHADDWHVARYTYEYLDVGREKRLAYHLHDIGSRRWVPHAHCESADDLADDEGTHHLRAVELDLREAHEEFMGLWAAGAIPERNRFRPLDIRRALDERWS